VERAVKKRVLYRFAWALVVMFGVTSIAFVTTSLLPGDPARALVGPQARPADVDHARAIYGFDQPIATQYARYMGHLVHIHRASDKPEEHASCGAVGPLHVDLGFSFYYRKPVVDLLATRAARSLDLAVAALFVQLLIGVGLGTLAGAKRGTTTDRVAIGAALVGVSAPTFLLGLILQYLLAYKLGALPLDGYGTSALDHTRSLVLPALTLGIFGSALYARIVRDEVASGLSREYVKTARAKGASEWRVVFVHVLRNAALSIATLAALDLGALVSGAVVTEKLFRWPGVGQLAVDAVLNREGATILGTVLFASFAVVMTTLALDLLAAALDPRIRQARADSVPRK
jgi:peptide/nickel transport system permease protein